MNLYDIVTLDTSPRQAPSADLASWDTWGRRNHTALAELQQMQLLDYGERDVLQKVLVKVDAMWGEKQALILKSGAILDGDSMLAKASRAPRMLLSEIKRIADVLGFIVFPYEYLDDRSIKEEKGWMHSRITRFASTFGKGFRVYVLGPISHYSVKKHVDSTDDLPIYTPVAVSQAFMAISMSLPMFRAMSADIKELKNGAADVRTRVERTEREINGLHERVAKLEREEVARKIESVRAAKLQQELRETERWYPRDPLMFAVRDGVDVSMPMPTSAASDVSVILGPCWGPDFPDIVTQVFKLPKIDGQRNTLEKAGEIFGARSTW